MFDDIYNVSECNIFDLSSTVYFYSNDLRSELQALRVGLKKLSGVFFRSDPRSQIDLLGRVNRNRVGGTRVDFFVEIFKDLGSY